MNSDSDLLAEIGRLIKRFDERMGSSTRAVLNIEKKTDEDSSTVSRVYFDPPTGYVPVWGKRIHPFFGPPTPGQMRLKIGDDKRVVIERR